MLMAFPLDFWEHEYAENAICSFGRVLNWEHDDRKLGRIIVRARVIDLVKVPQWIVLSEGEGFEGESWTIQCEILQKNPLGGLPAEEDEPPSPGQDPHAPFDFFGHGQQGPGPAPFQPVEDQPNPAAIANEGWAPWPDQVQQEQQAHQGNAGINLK